MVIDDSDTDGTDIDYLNDGRWNALTKKKRDKTEHAERDKPNTVKGKEMRKQHKE